MRFTNLEDFVKTDEQWNLLSEINTSLNNVYDKLSFLNKSGTSVEVYAAGGCIRDCILQQSPTIKDFDFYVVLNPVDDKGNVKDLDDYYVKLLSELYKNNKDLNIIKKFIKSSTNDSNYTMNDIHAVVEISKPTDQYPIELIFSPSSIEKTVYESFDFNICKAYMSRFTENADPEKNKKLIKNNIQVDHTFLYDIAVRKITFGATSSLYDLESFKKSLKKHYPRIKEKYSDYTLSDKLPCIYNDDDNAYNIVLKKYILNNEIAPTSKENSSKFKV